MQKNQIAFILCLIASIIYHTLRPGYISAMFINLFIVVFIVEIVLIVYTYTLFNVSSHINKRNIVRGNTINYSLYLENKTFLTFCPISLLYYGEKITIVKGSAVNNDHILVYPYSSQSIKQEILCSYCGTYYVGVQYIIITGFFRLLRIKYKCTSCHKVLVYPLIYDLQKIDTTGVQCEQIGQSLRTFYDHTQYFSDINNYKNGDSLNKIHWKLSAKHQDLMVKEFDENVGYNVKLIMNTNLSREKEAVHIQAENYLIEGSLSLIKHFLTESNPLEFTFGTSQKKRIFGNNLRDFDYFYETIAKVSFKKNNDSIIDSLMATTKNCKDTFLLILVTPVIDSNLSTFLMGLARQGNEVRVITLDRHSELFRAYYKVDMQEQSIKRLNKCGIVVNRFIFEENLCRLEVE